MTNCHSGVIYATTAYSEHSKNLLDSTLTTFLESSEENAELLYTLYYEQEQVSRSADSEPSDASLDLAFNDEILEEVETQWKSIVGDVDPANFMRFEDREGANDYDDELNEDF